MSQKIYTDRTTLLGIEAPSGQEYNVTVDDTGKLKSESKPDLSNFVEDDELGAVAFSNSYNDLDDKPTIPAQLNPTSGTGINITGTYPNLTFTNTSPNIVQDLNNTLSVGNVATTEAIFGATDNMTILGDGSGVLFSESGRTLNVSKPDNIDSNYNQNFQNKSGDIAVTTDIPDYVDSYVTNALSPYATQTYVKNYVAPVTFLDMDSDNELAINASRLPNTTFVFKDESLEGDLNKTFKIIFPSIAQKGTRFHLINADEKRTVTIQKWTGSEPDFIDLTNHTEEMSISIPPLSGVEIFCDGEVWYYSIK